MDDHQHLVLGQPNLSVYICKHIHNIFSFLGNSIPFKIRHKAYNTAQTAMVGFSLTATQVPCGNKLDQVAN